MALHDAPALLEGSVDAAQKVRSHVVIGIGHHRNLIRGIGQCRNACVDRFHDAGYVKIHLHHFNGQTTQNRQGSGL